MIVLRLAAICWQNARQSQFVLTGMKLFGAGKKEEKIVAILDIGSASAGGMIVRNRPGLNPEVLASVRLPVNFLADIDFQASWRCTRNSIKKVMKRLLKDFPSGPDEVVCVFSSPWFISQTRIISVKREDPFEVDKDFFDKLINNEINIFKSKWQSMTRDLRGEPEILEYKIMNVSLNGYRTRKPFGKKARALKAHIYMSLGIKKVKDEIKDDILENFGDTPVAFHTLPFAVFSPIRNIINPDWGYLFADIGGDVSDVSLVKDDILEETVSFPGGRNLPIRRIASQFKISIDAAVLLARKFKRGHASADEARKITPIMEGVKEEWRERLKRAISEISDNGPLPRDFFFIGGGDEGDEFAECAKDDFFSRFTVLGKPFKVARILPRAMEDHFEFRRSFEKDGDVFLMIESLFALKKDKYA